MVYGGYVGKILRVDLSTGSMTTLSTLDYVPDYIGGIGLGYRLLWDEINENTTEWSPENTLIFASGPTCGSGAPTSGRSELVGIAPQGYPIPYVAQSGAGGDFGPKMKWAGYDAIIITGKAETPKYLYVSEDGAELLDADLVWGMTNYTAQGALATKHGQDVAVVCIGPAGENRVRWAAIESRTENGFGQGGFGAVMGDKKLKGIVIKPGTVKVTIAKPDELIKEIVRVSGELAIPGPTFNKLASEKDGVMFRQQACGFSGCTSGADAGGNFPTVRNKVPQKYTGFGTVSGVEYCCPGCPSNLMEKISWQTRTEIRRLEGQLGFNHWETQIGMNIFIENSFNAGKLTHLLGEPITVDAEGKIALSPEFIVKWLKAVAYREGEGDIWAEGTPRAAELLGIEDEAWRTHKHGYGPHWDGRNQGRHFPFWVVSAVNWATQGRDPFAQQHGYCYRLESFVKEFHPNLSANSTETLPYEEVVKAAAKIYGAEHAASGWPGIPDDSLGYVDKEFPSIWHDYRAIMKSSVVCCDRVFPILLDPSQPDNVGDYEAETRLFNAVVGTDWSLNDMHKACERIYNLMRAFHVRQGRTRALDESVIPYYEQPTRTDDEQKSLDANKFIDLLERYYALRGWDKATGWPTRAKLEELDLKDVADELASIGKLP